MGKGASGQTKVDLTTDKSLTNQKLSPRLVTLLVIKALQGMISTYNENTRARIMTKYIAFQHPQY